jgi:lipopolysaccharide export system permease protein
MRQMTRYILTQLLVATLFVAFCLTCAIWLTQSLRFVDLIVNRGLSLPTFVWFAMLLMPSFLAVVLPVAAFAAVLFTYNKLVMDSELVVMRATGLGPIALAWPALILASGVMVMGYALNLYFLPVSYREFKDLQFQIRNNYASVLIQEGVFTSLGEGLTVYVSERARSGELAGILVHDDRDPEKRVTFIADRGMLLNTDSGPRVSMIDGSRQEWDRKQHRMSMLHFERYTIELGQLSNALAERWREPRERFLHELFSPDGTAGDQFYATRMRVEGHERLVTPFLTLTFTIVALAALLSGDFSRRGQTTRVLGAIGVVFAVQAGAIGLSNAAVKWPLVIPGMYAMAIAPALLGLLVMIRPPRRRRLPAQPAAA